MNWFIFCGIFSASIVLCIVVDEAWQRTAAQRADLREALRLIAARRLRRRYAVDRANLKAAIIRVGEAEVGRESIVIGEGWEFDLSNGAPVHSIGPDGVPRFCGYTVPELKEVHARRAEFNVDA